MSWRGAGGEGEKEVKGRVVGVWLGQHPQRAAPGVNCRLGDEVVKKRAGGAGGSSGDVSREATV